MSGRVDGKVVFITGAARGQGRAHAVRLAEEGADIIATDLCTTIETCGYPMGSADDLTETAALVEKLGRRVVTYQADVRDRTQLARAFEQGVEHMGKLDVVIANAGILPLGPGQTAQAFMDVNAVNLLGVINTLELAYPYLTAGASLIATGSTAALRNGGIDNPSNGSGGVGYRYSKKEVARYVDSLAKVLAPEKIRVNAVHPTNVNTHMLHSDGIRHAMRPDLDDPTVEEAQASMMTQHPWPSLAYVEPEDIADAMLFLASDEARYVTGLQLRVDGGGLSGTLLD